MIGIYKITNHLGQVYIGQSNNIERRFKAHKYNNNKGKIHNSIKEHGVLKHSFEILEICDKHLLNNKERYWQDFYKSTSKDGLNIKLANNTIYKNGKRQRIVTCKDRIDGGKIILLDMCTGVYFYGCEDASLSYHNLNRYTLREYIIGRRINKTNIIRV